MKNSLIIIAVVALLGLGGWYYTSQQTTGTEDSSQTGATEQTTGEASIVTPGNYTVITEESELHWAGKKPLIEGYIDSGTIDFKDGAITVTDTSATGVFNFDMNTVHVGLTAKKPGKESALEEHLKKGDFFDVTKFPNASFEITSVALLDASALTYTTTGKLTMKGITHEVTFPAKIYKDAGGKLHAEASFAIDRTKWNITF